MTTDQSYCQSEIARILAMKQGKPGTKLILILLTMHPEGLTIYQIMDLLGHPPENRRVIQRQMEWTLATGQVRQSHRGTRGSNNPIIYTKGRIYDPHHQGTGPTAKASKPAVRQGYTPASRGYPRSERWDD